MKPRKWAAEIKAWADGAEIQYRHDSLEKWQDYDTTWKDKITPSWTQDGLEFRVKPEKKEPGEVLTDSLWRDHDWNLSSEHAKACYNKAALDVINAYKAGEIE